MQNDEYHTRGNQIYIQSLLKIVYGQKNAKSTTIQTSISSIVTTQEKSFMNSQLSSKK